MSFLKRMFGGTTAEAERLEADRLYEVGNFFEARQAYERALGKSKGASAELREHCESRASKCLDALAEARIEDAERLRAEGQLEIARGELETAIDLARSGAVRERARRAIEMLERRDAIEQAEAGHELSDDDRWAVIAGTWEQTQLDEYDEYGDAFRDAILAMHEGRTKDARPVLEALLEEHGEEAVYLWLELGRARLADADEEGGAKALRRFLKRIADTSGEDDRSDARLAAHLALASLADRKGDEERAIKWLQKALDAMPDDPRPYLQLGVYLREKGHPEEAIEVLDTAIELMDDDRPSWEAFQELGLAKMDAGHDQEAIELLEKVLRFFVSRSRLDFPRTAALPLARLSEKVGNLERAADLYRNLANGSDRANHLEYHREAGRVLAEIGLHSEARRMLTRAAALADAQPEILATIEADIVALDARLD